MPFFYDQDADRLGLSPWDLEAVNEALRQERVVANPLSLTGNSKVWFSRVFRINKLLSDVLPDRFNSFRQPLSSVDARPFRILRLQRLEVPFVRAVIQREGTGTTETVSFPLAPLEQALACLIDAHESGYLVDSRDARTRHRLTSENTTMLLREHGPLL